MPTKLISMLALLFAAAAFAQTQDSGLSEYHFVIDSQRLASLGAPISPFGNILEVFVRGAAASTDTLRVIVRYQNRDGSLGSASGFFAKAEDSDTLASFRAPDAEKILSVIVEEKTTTNSKEFH